MELGHKAVAKEIVDKEKAKKLADLKIAGDKVKRAEALHTAAEGKEKEAKAALAEIMQLPSNTPFGDRAAYKGELRLLSGDTWKMNSYIKFPTTTLAATDTIVQANLRLFKYSGGSGTINVQTATCGWSRKDLTWTGAEVSPGGLTLKMAGAHQEVVGEGDVNVKQWVEIKLHGDIVQAARLTGAHICMKISGGPSDGFATFASEDTEDKPQLKMYVKQDTMSTLKAMDKSRTDAKDDDARRVRARGEFRLNKIDSLTRQLTLKHTQQFVATTKTSTAYIDLMKERAKYELDAVNYPQLYDQWAGLDGDELLATKQTNIDNLLNQDVTMYNTTLKLRSDAAIKEKLVNVDGMTDGSEAYNTAFGEAAATASVARNNNVTEYENNMKVQITNDEEKKMQEIIEAKRLEAVRDINESIDNFACLSEEKCVLTDVQKATVDSEVQTKLNSAMTLYDAENAITPELKTRDVLTREQLQEEATEAEVKQGDNVIELDSTNPNAEETAAETPAETPADTAYTSAETPAAETPAAETPAETPADTADTTAETPTEQDVRESRGDVASVSPLLERVDANGVPGADKFYGNFDTISMNGSPDSTEVIDLGTGSRSHAELDRLTHDDDVAELTDLE